VGEWDCSLSRSHDGYGDSDDEEFERRAWHYEMAACNCVALIVHSVVLQFGFDYEIILFSERWVNGALPYCLMIHYLLPPLLAIAKVSASGTADCERRWSSLRSASARQRPELLRTIKIG
jgi:hypothetical protein